MSIGITIIAHELTLADLIAVLAMNQSLSETRRRDLISAITTATVQATRRPHLVCLGP